MKTKIKIILIIVIAIGFLSFIENNKPTPYVFPEMYLFPKMPANPNNVVTNEGVTLGRFLFYDSILSLNYNMSCASCHKQKNAFSDAPNNFSYGYQNIKTNRNTLPLFNLAWYQAYFWDGRAASIEAQVFHPVSAITELNLNWVIAEKRIQNSEFYKPMFEDAFGKIKIDSILITKAISQFLRTLLSYQSKFDRALIGEDTLTTEEHLGFGLLSDQTKGNCIHCHTTDGNILGTTGKFSNNGLDLFSSPMQYTDKGLGGFTNKISDYGKFRIPSLRNVEVTAPYMHDGRFNTLEEVLKFYSEGVNLSPNLDNKMFNAHSGGVCLTEVEQKAIVAFLKTLTDSTFISNPNFSNPFVD